MIQKGSYRIFIPCGPFGIKIARLNFSSSNIIATFLAGMIMNLLERKRYLYYVKRKSFKNGDWISEWDHDEKPYRFAPTYFTCGLFNVVKRAKPCVKKEINEFDEVLRSETGSMVEIKYENFGKIDNEIVALDYGDFCVLGYNRMNVRLIDYK